MRKRRKQEEKAPPVLQRKRAGAQGILLAGEVALLYGEAKAGKSRAAVALLAWERLSGEHARRSEAWELLPPPELRFYLYHQTETRYSHLARYAEQMGAMDIAQRNFLPFAQREELQSALRAIHILAKEAGKPALVVVDSLIKLVPPEQSENEAKAMDTVMAWLKEAILPPAAGEPAVGLVVIHHATKGNYGPRGSGAIAANADHLLVVRPKAHGESEGEWNALIYEKGRGDVEREAEEILAVRVRSGGRALRSQPPSGKARGSSPTSTAKPQRSLVDQARVHFQGKAFTQEELVAFLVHLGQARERAENNFRVWRARKKILALEGGRYQFR
ncbi:hypothetical protein TJA_20230 [Thermus sp. LT1-2-5]|uniref:AAA family ATPase n=1 Tax=Thermus sp. LT1-2-5 TaxID=3026935 RepID=UPI0030E7712C